MCGGELSHGYLLGKHSRIRWSSTKEGMTIFHGVPLIKSGKKYWSNWKNWVYAPSIPAMRCENCKQVFFLYDNEEPENPQKEKIALIIFGATLIVFGVLLAVLALCMGSLGLGKLHFLRLTLMLFALIIAIPGLVLVKYAIAKKSQEKGI
jgi:hypothetical protein